MYHQFITTRNAVLCPLHVCLPAITQTNKAINQYKPKPRIRKCNLYAHKCLNLLIAQYAPATVHVINLLTLDSEGIVNESDLIVIGDSMTGHQESKI